MARPTSPELSEVLRRVYRPAATLALGTGLGQGLVLLATPFLARAYPPASFGTLALLVTVGNVAMAAACLRYDLALPSAAERDVRGLFVAATAAALATGLLAAGVAAALSRTSWGAGRGGALLAHPVLLGACVSLVGLHQAASAWLLRRAAYGGVSVLRVAQGGGFGLLAAFQRVGLLWAHALSFAGGLAAAGWILRRPGEPGATWIEAARRHREFPLYSLPGAFLDAAGYGISVWVVASAYGAGAAGEYSQIQRIIGAPMMLLSMSLGQVLLKHTADLAEDRDAMWGVLLRLLRVLGALAGGALVALWVAGAPVIGLILGPDWRIEREMVVLLGLAVFVRACVSPLTATLVTLRRFGRTLAWQASYFASAALLMPWVAGRVPLRAYVAFYAGHELVFYGAYLWLVLSAVRRRSRAGSSGS